MVTGGDQAARRRAIALALATLHQFADQAGPAPIRPDIAIRAALACLYAFSNGDRAPFDEYWEAARDEMSWSTEYMRGLLRPGNLRTAICGIALAVGIDEDEQIFRELYRKAMS